MKLMFIFLIILAFNYSICITKSHRQEIISDSQRPLITKYPNEYNQMSIEIRFSFDKLGIGLLKNQFLAVEFKSNFNLDFNLSSLIKEREISNNEKIGEIYSFSVFNFFPKYECYLTSEDNEVYNVVEVKADFSNTAFCQILNDLPVGKTFILEIKLKENSIKTFTTRLFTTTSSKDFQILDSIFIGSALLSTVDVNSLINSYFSIINFENSNGDDTFPEDIFSVSITIKLKNDINFIDQSLIIEIPTDAVSYDSEIPDFEVKEIDKDKENTISQVSLNIIKLNFKNEDLNSSFLFSNIVQNKNIYSKDFLIKNGEVKDKRSNVNLISSYLINFPLDTILKKDMVIKFKLNSLRAKNIIGVSKDVNFKLFHKNSFTLLSFSNISAFKYSKASINYNFKNSAALTSGIHHIEFWDIYANAVWPIKFIFKTEAKIKKGAFLKIQHIIGDSKNSKINFISSSCDLSDNNPSKNEMFPNEKGKRPVCFPLNYPSSDNDIGSGFFFKLVDGLEKETFYSVGILINVEKCGLDNVFDPTLADNSKSFANLKFKYTIVDSIKENKTGYSRLDTIVIAESLEIQMHGKCWNTKKNENFYDYYKEVKNRPLEEVSEGKDYLLFKEFTDFQIAKIEGENCSSCFMDNVNDYPYLTNVTNGYFYSSSQINQIEQSYFLLRFYLENESLKEKVDALERFHFADLLPLPVYSIEDDTPVNKVKDLYYQKGKLRFLFSKKWFSFGDDSCYISWAARINSLQSLSQTSLFNKGSISGELNFISNTNDTIDKTNTYIPSVYSSELHPLPEEISNKATATNKITPFKITSMLNDVQLANSSVQIYWTYMKDVVKTLNLKEMPAEMEGFFYSNCVKTTALIPFTLKTLFAPFEFQVDWLGISAGKALNLNELKKNDNFFVTRVTRFFKLLPQVDGVFNDDNKKINLEINGNDSFFYVHQVTGKSITNNFVCLLEVDKIIVENGLKHGTFVLFLHNFYLLETDYNEVSAQYPAGPVPLNVDVFGFPSERLHSENSEYLDNNPIVVPFNFLGSKLLLIRNSFYTHSTVSENLYVPFYCSTSTKQYQYISSLSINFLKFNSVGPVQKMFLIDYIPFIKIVPSDTKPEILRTTLKFNNYTSSSKTKELYMNYDLSYSDCFEDGEIKTINISKNSSFIYFFTKDIDIGLNALISNNINKDIKLELDGKDVAPAVVSFKAFSFYVFGFKFNSGIYYTSKGINTEKYSKVILKNITRPTFDQLIKLNDNDDDKKTRLINFQDYGLSNLIGMYILTEQDVITNMQSGFNSISSLDLEKESFLLEFDQSTWTNGIFSIELNSSNLINTNYLAELSLSINSSLNLLSESFFEIKGNLIYNDSSCFISTNNISLDCFVLQSKLVCPLNFSKFSSFSQVNIKCYNVKITDYLIEINSLENYFWLNKQQKKLVSLKYDSQIINGKKIFQKKIYDVNNIFYLKNFEFIPDIEITIPSISFKHTENQENATGALEINFTSNFAFPRNAKIQLFGDFSMLKLSTKQNCALDFDVVDDIDNIYNNLFSNYESNSLLNNIFVDNCKIFELSKTSTNNGFLKDSKKEEQYSIPFMEINIKNDFFEGVKVPNSFRIIIFPVKLASIGSNEKLETIKNIDDTLLQNGYIKVKMFINNSEIFLKSNYVQIPKVVLDKEKKIYNQEDKLCSVKEILPLYEGSYSTWTFSITPNFSLFSLLPNEIKFISEFSIYLDFKVWSFNQSENLVCYYNGDLVTCNISYLSRYNGYAILNISVISSKIKFNLRNDHLIKVVGILNNFSNYENFVCSLNSYEVTRTVVVQGYGIFENQTLINKIKSENMTSLDSIINSEIVLKTKIYNLETLSNVELKQIDTLEINKNVEKLFVYSPRSSQEIRNIFKLNNIIVKPTLVVTLPGQYNQHLNSIQTLLNEDLDQFEFSYYFKIKLQIYSRKEQLIQSKDVAFTSRQNNNQIIINISEDLKGDFEKEFFFEVTIQNIFSPIEETLASPLSFYLYNDEVIYHNFLNVQKSKENLTQSNSLTEDLFSFSFLNFNKGLKYSFNGIIDSNNNNKYKRILDIVQYWEGKKGQNNKLILKQGRYVRAYFTIRNNYFNHSSAATAIRIKHSFQSNSLISSEYIKLLEDEYQINSANKSSIEFFIGLSCNNRLREKIILLFSSSNKVDFYSPPPIEASIDISRKASIFLKYKGVSSEDFKILTSNVSLYIRPKSFAFVTFYMDELPFEAIGIKTSLKGLSKIKLTSFQSRDIIEYNIKYKLSLDEVFKSDQNLYKDIKIDDTVPLEVDNLEGLFFILPKDLQKIISLSDNGLEELEDKKELVEFKLLSPYGECYTIEMSSITVELEANKNSLVNVQDSLRNQFTNNYGNSDLNIITKNDNTDPEGKMFNNSYQNDLDYIIFNTSYKTVLNAFGNSFEFIENDQTVNKYTISFKYQHKLLIQGLLYCQLICNELEFTSELDLLNHVMQSSIENDLNTSETLLSEKSIRGNEALVAPSSYIRIFSTLITGKDSSSETDEILVQFNNLKRHLLYKIKCYFSTTERVVSRRTIISTILSDDEKQEYKNMQQENNTNNDTKNNNVDYTEEYNKSKGIISEFKYYQSIRQPKLFSTAKLQKTKCLQMVFNDEPVDTFEELSLNLFNENTKNEKNVVINAANETNSYFNQKVLSYCQNLFTRYGFRSNGCFKCVNQYGEKASGFDLLDDDKMYMERNTCTHNEYLWKDEIKTLSQKRHLILQSEVEKKKKVLSVCVIQQNNCPSNLSNNQYYDNLILKFASDLNSVNSIIKNLNLKENYSQLETTDKSVDFLLVKQAKAYNYSVLLEENSFDLDKVYLENTNYDKNSYTLSFIAKTDYSRIKCIYSINPNPENNLMLNYNEIILCNRKDSIICGNFKTSLDDSPVKIKFVSDLLPGLYSIFCTCNHDIYYFTPTFQVKRITNFQVQEQETQTMDSKNKTDTTSNTNSTVMNNSLFIKSSLLISFIFLIGLL